ncbi:MAG: hypothetical protein V7L23_15415 [Nostoc sp.]|uniref:hypothetical protein n=1 Tax=Nostoc sp. TaxID=1180 RepID=UPI002FEF9FA7
MFNIEEDQEVSGRISAIAIARKLGKRLPSEVEATALKKYVWDSLRGWGLCPISNVVGQSSSYDNALYSMDCALVREVIINFIDRESKAIYPSENWLDVPSIAIFLNLPGEFCRSSLSEYVTDSLQNVFGLYPVRGRMGATGPALNARDGGLFPVNNALVRRIVKSYFKESSVIRFTSTKNEGRLYLSRVCA